MLEYLIIALVLIGGLIVGFLVSSAMNKKGLAQSFESAQSDSERILKEAQTEKERMIAEAHNEAKNEAKNRRLQFETEAKKRRTEITKLEEKVKTREQTLEKKLSQVEKKENDLEKMTLHLNTEEERLKAMIKESERAVEDTRRTLETIANLSQEEAKRELIRSLETEAKNAAKETLRKIEEDTKAEGERIARSMVSLSVQRVSSEYVNDSTVTVVSLPSDEMKGRIIGREGRNIRAIEQATGVDLIIDDTPEAIIISCFNPVRREIANISLQRLIADGRIHPARIDETVKKVSEEFDQIIQENGEQAAFDTGITDLHPELLRALGKLKYRTAGAQTVLQHAVEVAHICGIMAGEMGLNVKRAKRAGLLHDIGKSVDQETEGHHSRIGADLAAKFNENSEVIDAILNHHNEDLNRALPLTVIVHAANILSERRPGARREVLETYVKRLQDMETIVNTTRGIQGSYVIQAGREIRALVTPEGISDSEVVDVANEIAHRLRKELTFPGQVKVTVLRESRHAEYAK
ncbi:MAG: ribonuclease Y [Proteobacteria bacterium]|nr:MAG: ribonuclease Y [Pseudomonadota bacterium]